MIKQEYKLKKVLGKGGTKMEAVIEEYGRGYARFGKLSKD